MSKPQVHYNLDKLDSLGATYNLIYGEKSNGKSYQIKHKKAIVPFIETGQRFFLFRRWNDDVSTLWIEKYFSDVDIAKYTSNEYNTVVSYRKSLYFGKVDNDMKVSRGDKIGYVGSLSAEQHVSSGSFLDVTNMIFEEFMARGLYIAKEPDKLMAFYSTVDRKRGTTRLWLVGNTIARTCPYLEDWNLMPIIRKQKQGEIDTVDIPTEDDEAVKLAIEHCPESGGKKMAIGRAKGMIDSGQWMSDPQPHLPKGRKAYHKVWAIGFQYDSFQYIAEFLQDNETRNFCWHVYPFYKQFPDKMIVFSNFQSPLPTRQRNIYDITINNPSIQNILNTFRDGIIFYSDDLTGTEFKEKIDFTIRR